MFDNSLKTRKRKKTQWLVGHRPVFIKLGSHSDFSHPLGKKKKRPHLSLLAWCPSHITAVRKLLRVHGKSRPQLTAASSDWQAERDQIIPQTFPVVRDRSDQCLRHLDTDFTSPDADFSQTEETAGAACSNQVVSKYFLVCHRRKWETTTKPPKLSPSRARLPNPLLFQSCFPQ